ncbi:MAG TPA: hypothetical protein VM345_19370 [Acidimicrobiales bacterium]|jgi:hypothetical protein|nr:hypothetical protein [Acidimicrobiales bacterium]
MDEELPVATRGDEQPRASGDTRATYRAAAGALAAVLLSLILGRGYGIELPAAGASERRVEGEWVSVPWQLVSSATPNELHLAVDASACARVVSYEVSESPTTVRVTVWRRQPHTRCTQLSVVVRLDAPLGARNVEDGGVIAVD